MQFNYYYHLQTTGLQGKGEGISLAPHYHYHPFQRHLDITPAITEKNLALHIGLSIVITNACEIRWKILTWTTNLLKKKAFWLSNTTYRKQS